MKANMKNRVTWVATWNLHADESTEIVCAEGTREEALKILIDTIEDKYDEATVEAVKAELENSDEASIKEFYTTFTLTMLEF